MSSSRGLQPALLSREAISARLARIFPEGTEQHTNLTREMAASTVFVMLYVGAIEGSDRWVRPNQITRMTHAQARRTSEAEREAWRSKSLRPSGPIPGRWYADNTREPIRDEILRNGLLPVGAVLERPGIKKTAQTPRWALARDFAELFLVSEEQFGTLLSHWRERHLSQAARARLVLLQQGVVATATQEEILVTFPNKRTRYLSPGESSLIAKGVIEVFAPRFLEKPGVILVSETSRKEEAVDLRLAQSVGLPIPANELLPDIILVDLGPENPLFVFVEVVASDGPVTPLRKAQLTALLEQGGHHPRSGAFVTALMDRGSPVYRGKVASQSAWDTFIWFVTEPDKLVIQRDFEHQPVRLSALMGTPQP
jgi:hypothetical protein